ncbi:hypothetical protein V8C86DRAFT_3100660 [Haematococcus lacustris]
MYQSTTAATIARCGGSVGTVGALPAAWLRRRRRRRLRRKRQEEVAGQRGVLGSGGADAWVLRRWQPADDGTSPKAPLPPIPNTLPAQVADNDDATSPACSFGSLLSRLTSTLTNNLTYWLVSGP